MSHSVKVPKKPSMPNKRPMVSKNTAPGLRELLAAVDRERIAGSQAALKAEKYLHDLIEYLESDHYKQKSIRQTATADEWRKKRAQTGSANDQE